MQRPVDPARFGDAVIIFRPRIVVPGLEFLDRNLVGRVAVHLIRAEKNKDRIRAMLPRHLQQVDGAQCVDFEIQQGNFSRFVVGRLRRAMHNQVEALRGK